MIDGRKVLALIPAREGSKGVAGKNIKNLAGKPLINYTIEAALKSTYLDKVIVSTDGGDIAKTAISCGAEVPFMRPAEFSGDSSSSIDVVLHAISLCPGYEIIVLLQPTSPFRSKIDIDNCLNLFKKKSAVSCVSVELVKKHPAWCYQIHDDLMIPIVDSGGFTQRQQFEDIYSLNGAVYVLDVEWVKEHKKIIAEDTVANIMPAARSIDIDTEYDFYLANLLAEDKQRNSK